MLSILADKNGNGLLNALIGMGITAIVIGVVSSTIVNSQKETRNLEAKLGALELQRTLSSITPGMNICAFAIAANPTSFKVNKDTFLTATFPITKLALDLAGSQVIAENNKPLLGLNQIRVKNIRIMNLLKISGKIVGDLIIDFETERAIKSIYQRITLQSEIVVDDFKLLGCSTSGSTSASVNLSPTNQETCEAISGSWVVPPPGRPEFCMINNDTLEWY